MNYNYDRCRRCNRYVEADELKKTRFGRLCEDCRDDIDLDETYDADLTEGLVLEAQEAEEV